MVFKFCITAFFLMLCSGIPSVEFGGGSLRCFWWIGWNLMGGPSPCHEIPVGVVLIGTYASLLGSWRWRVPSLSTPPACGRRENTPDAALGSGRRKKILFFLVAVTHCHVFDLVLGLGLGRKGIGRGGRGGLWRISFLSDTAFLCYIFFFSEAIVLLTGARHF